MRYLTYLFALMISMTIVSCGTTSTLTSYEDDIYYSPKAETQTEVTRAENTEFSAMDDAESASEKSATNVDPYYDEDYAKGRAVDGQWSGSVDRGNGRYYDEDDFYYSSRIRRFHRFNNGGFNYYDPFFTSYWYGSPSYYRPNFWQPTYYNSGFGYSNFYMADNFWGYSPGYATNWAYSGFGYNPYSYYGYGNSFYNGCPNYGWGGNVFVSDVASNNGFYTGQYTTVGGFTNTASSIASRSKELKPVQRDANAGQARGVETRPTSTQSQTRSSEPYVRPRTETRSATSTETDTRRRQTRVVNTPRNNTYRTTPTPTRRTSPTTTRSTTRSSSGATRSTTTTRKRSGNR